ncbi:hypothetical protein [Dechloromonas sp. H13]|uniref:hypothetical protein n=1 Tax=Dechloromonas sp. H13 TaxID=2570193 RepID=UPI001291AD13|nr:hypothetical protein [Dechloromonas sp. H13]
MLAFLIGALRAVVEMVGLCLIGQGALYLLAGERRRQNVIYRFFDLVTGPPRRVAARLLPRHSSQSAAGLLAFFLLFALWIGLAWLRKFL